MSKGFCSAEQGKRASGAGPLALHPIPRSGTPKKSYLRETLTEIGTYNGGRSGRSKRDVRLPEPRRVFLPTVGICVLFTNRT